MKKILLVILCSTSTLWCMSAEDEIKKESIKKYDTNKGRPETLHP